MGQISAPVETWLPVVGYGGFYEVSSLGRVRSLDRIVLQRRNGASIPQRCRGRILKQRVGSEGYLMLSLSRDGHAELRDVHRLVLEAFAGPCPEGMEALHGAAGQHVNAWPENLRWGTHVENCADKNRDGTQPRGGECPWAKLTEDQVADIRATYAEGGVSQRRLAAEFGLSHAMISYLVTGKKWSR